MLGREGAERGGWAEIHDWLVRESGAIRPFAGFQTRAVAAEECFEAAALASHPYGQLLRSSLPRLSMPAGSRSAWSA